MDSITQRDVHAAAKYIEMCEPYADIHTVTITLNGQHGGADVRIEGTTAVGYPNEGDEYVRTYQI